MHTGWPIMHVYARNMNNRFTSHPYFPLANHREKTSVDSEILNQRYRNQSYLFDRV